MNRTGAFFLNGRLLEITMSVRVINVYSKRKMYDILIFCILRPEHKRIPDCAEMCSVEINLHHFLDC